MARQSRRRVPKATRDDEYRQLLEQAPNDLYRDLFVAMRWAGLRVSEAVGLRWDNVDLARLQITVIGKGNVERTIDVLPEAEAMLRRRLSDSNQLQTVAQNMLHNVAYHRQDDQNPERSVAEKVQHFVFPRPNGLPLTTRAVQRTVQAIREKLDLPPERLTPHKLRHAYATDLVNRGVPIHVVSAQLGHADVSTTSIYLHAQPGQARRYFDRDN